MLLKLEKGRGGQCILFDTGAAALPEIESYTVYKTSNCRYRANRN